MMTRRTFVGALATVAAAGGLGLGGVLARRRRLAVTDIDPTVLRQLQGTTLTLRAAGRRQLHAVVADVRAVTQPARRGAPGTEQISLLLKANDRHAPAGNYGIESDDVSLGELYFSPVGLPGRDRRLEAVITRIV